MRPATSRRAGRSRARRTTRPRSVCRIRVPSSFRRYPIGLSPCFLMLRRCLPSPSPRSPSRRFHSSRRCSRPRRPRFLSLQAGYQPRGRRQWHDHGVGPKRGRGSPPPQAKLALRPHWSPKNPSPGTSSGTTNNVSVDHGVRANKVSALPRQLTTVRNKLVGLAGSPSGPEKCQQCWH
jgi:hypothetical protein